MGEKIESGVGVDARDLDDLDPVVRGALCVGRIGCSENVGYLLRGSLYLLAVVPRPHDALLGDPTEDPRHREKAACQSLAFRSLRPSHSADWYSLRLSYWHHSRVFILSSETVISNRICVPDLPRQLPPWSGAAADNCLAPARPRYG